MCVEGNGMLACPKEEAERSLDPRGVPRKAFLVNNVANECHVLTVQPWRG